MERGVVSDAVGMWWVHAIVALLGLLMLAREGGWFVRARPVSARCRHDAAAQLSRDGRVSRRRDRAGRARRRDVRHRVRRPAQRRRHRRLRSAGGADLRRSARAAHDLHDVADRGPDRRTLEPRQLGRAPRAGRDARERRFVVAAAVGRGPRGFRARRADGAARRVAGAVARCLCQRDAHARAARRDRRSRTVRPLGCAKATVS